MQRILGSSDSSSALRTTARLLLAAALSVVLAACGQQGETQGAADAAVEVSAGSIAAAELAALIEAGNAPVILDVRSVKEYEKGHIPGSINIPHDQLATRLEEVSSSRTEEIVVHCQKGGRAALAQETLLAAGFTNVQDLDGHWKGWQTAGLPTE